MFDFSQSLTIANKEITGKKSITEKFNSFFVNTGQIWQLKILHCSINFE